MLDSWYMTSDQFLTSSLQWRHNGRDGVSNHQPHDCLLNRLFRRRSNKTSELRVTGLCGEFTDDRWIHSTNGQLRGKCFNLMTSSWIPGAELSFHSRPWTDMVLNMQDKSLSSMRTVCDYMYHASIKCIQMLSFPKKKYFSTQNAKTR